MHVAVMSGVGERLLNYKSATSCDDERICVAVRCARVAVTSYGDAQTSPILACFAIFLAIHCVNKQVLDA
eukprot:scaffold288295_cov19-Tisochrysis_lutea.AAC.2